MFIGGNLTGDKMKRTLALLLGLMLFLPISLRGQESYFCNKEGCTLEYIRKYTDGDIKWYHTMKIINVLVSEGKGTIVYSSEMKNGKGKPLFDSPVRMNAFVDGGDVTVNIAESVKEIFIAKLGKKIGVSSIGGESTIPSEMAPGDTLPDVSCSVSAMGLTMDINVTGRTVLRTETIITPAGEFECVVVREKKSEVGMGRRRYTTADTWYSRGFGMIRHDTYNKKGILETSEVLQSYKTALQ